MSIPTPEPNDSGRSRRSSTLNTLARIAAGALVVSALAAGCADSPLPPTSPIVPFVLPPTYTIAGRVTEVTLAGPVPVEGVRLEDLASRNAAMTDQNGDYTIIGARVAESAVSATKAGYLVETKGLTVTGPTRLDIVVTRNGTNTLSGVTYEMTPAGRVPIQGIALYCDNCGGPDGPTWAVSDSKGRYLFDWVQHAITYLQVFGNDSYRYAGPPPERTGLPVLTHGDTEFDIEFVPR